MTFNKRGFIKLIIAVSIAVFALLLTSSKVHADTIENINNFDTAQLEALLDKGEAYAFEFQDNLDENMVLIHDIVGNNEQPKAKTVKGQYELLKLKVDDMNNFFEGIMGNKSAEQSLEEKQVKIQEILEAEEHSLQAKTGSFLDRLTVENATNFVKGLEVSDLENVEVLGLKAFAFKQNIENADSNVAKTAILVGIVALTVFIFIFIVVVKILKGIYNLLTYNSVANYDNRKKLSILSRPNV